MIFLQGSPKDGPQLCDDGSGPYDQAIHGQFPFAVFILNDCVLFYESDIGIRIPFQWENGSHVIPLPWENKPQSLKAGLHVEKAKFPSADAHGLTM